MMAGGRPKKFNTSKQLRKLLQEFLDYAQPHPADRWVTVKLKRGYKVKMQKVLTEQVPITISNACVYLGIHRDTWHTYSGKDEFSDTMKWFKQICEAYTEDQLYKGNTNGAKFSLIHNHGWHEKIEVEHSGKLDRSMSEEELDAIIERAERRAAS